MNVEEKVSSNRKPPLARGLVVSWVAQVLQIVSGFVVPRIIDHSMGSETLGVWDLAWSLVSYFTLLEGGIGASINRHVALYRADQDMGKTNSIVSSVAMLQRAMGGAVLLLTILLTWKLHWILQNVSHSLESQARWLVLLLGSSVALSFSGGVYTGIITGCHRWATHHGVYAATNILSVVGMVSVLLCGQGIAALAVVHLITELSGRVARAVIAYRICPGLSIRLRHADFKTLGTMLSFGGRMILGRVSQILMVQTTNVLIATHLGPAALALFARPRSLVRQAAVFPQKYAIMLIPSVAAVAAAGKMDEVRAYVSESGRNGLWLSLPVIVFLAISGPSLMQLWMGSHYVDPSLILFMTLGLSSELFNMPLNNLLMGLNMHGRPGVVSLIAAGVAVVLVWVALTLQGSLSMVALAIGIPWTFAYGVYLPVYACRRLEMSVRRFFVETWKLPLLCMLPFALCLEVGRLAFPHHPLAALAAGGVPGGIVLAICYWRYALPPNLKDKIKRRFRRSRTTGGRPPESPPVGLSISSATAPSDTNT